VHKHPTSDNTDSLEGGYRLIGAMGAGYYVVLSRFLHVDFGE
jgi:hypothetical protein